MTQYKCEESESGHICKKQADIFERLNSLIDAHCTLQDVHFAMENKFEKLLAFVREISKGFDPDEDYAILQKIVDHEVKAEKILKEIGEL